MLNIKRSPVETEDNKDTGFFELKFYKTGGITMNGHLRKSNLKAFADTQLRYDKNRACALVNIVKKAADQVAGMQHPATLMIDDLEKVLIGTDMRRGRGRGGYFVGNFNGAEGFRRELRDTFNQVQHAAAGIVIGFRHGLLGHLFANWQEAEPQDDLLYDATCPLGRRLSDSNYSTLFERLRAAICDDPSICIGPVMGPGDFPKASPLGNNNISVT